MMTKTVRIVACLMAVLMALSGLGMIALYISAAEVYDGTSVSASLSGTGTEADPYLIANGADLAYFASSPVDGAFYKLTADIVWSSYTKGGEAPAATNWTPIEDFKGNFDGNGYSISGIYVKGEKFAAVFATASGSIKNLTVKDSYFEGTKYVGSLVGQVPTADDKASMLTLVIDNCVNYADIVSTGDKSLVGGIIGDAYANAKNGKYVAASITNCVNYGKVSASGGTTLYTGGIIGRTYGAPSIIENCANFGDVYTEVGALIGGIVGQASISEYSNDEYKVSIKNCFNAGNVTAFRIGGGIIGRAYPTTEVTNCVNIGNVTILALNETKDGYNDQYGPITGHGPDKRADAATFDNCGTITNCYTSADAVITNTADASATPFYASAATVKTAAELNSDAMVAALGEAYALVDGKLTLKSVANAGKVEVEQPEDTTPEETTAEDTTVEDTTVADETTEPGSSGNTSDSAVLYIVIALLAIAGTAFVAKRREN